MRHAALLALALLYVGGGAASAAAEPGAQPPNFVVIVADDMGWTDASTGRTNDGKGSLYHQTPNIDRLADEGMSFSSAYAFQNCKPTRASLLTGQNPVRHWVYAVSGFQNAGDAYLKRVRIAPPSGHRKDLAPTTVALPEVLRTAGYRSTFIGKEHGFGPRRNLTRAHGFDVDLSLSKRQKVPGKGGTRHYLAIPRGDGGWKFSRPEFDAYAAPYSKQYVERELVPFANGNDPRALVGKPKHLTDAIADAARDIIADEARRPGPFFLEVAFHAVHRAIVPRPDLLAKYEVRAPVDLRHGNPGYAALLEGLDQSVGRILAALDDPDGDGDPGDSIRGSTLVVFLSDNGGVNVGSNRPLKGKKSTFDEGGLRVPLVARLPGTIAAGAHTDEPVSVIDLYPTLAELAGAALPDRKEHPVDGRSLVPLLTGHQPQLDRSALYWHFPGYHGTGVTPLSIINGRHDGHRYKLIWSYEELHYTLYDLTEDPGESRDLLVGEPSAKHLEVATELARELRTWVVKRRAPRGWVRRLNVPVEPPPLYEDYAAG